MPAGSIIIIHAGSLLEYSLANERLLLDHIRPALEDT